MPADPDRDTRNRPPSSDPELRFLVDGMLLRVGKYLRCLGHDTTWNVRWTTLRAARQAELEGRVLVTRNSRLGGEVPAPARWLRVGTEEPMRALDEIRRAFGLEGAGARPFSRCLRCNHELRPAAPEEVLPGVPASVRERRRRFFTCPGCRRVFWLGDHVANTCRRLGVPAPSDGAAGDPAG